MSRGEVFDLIKEIKKSRQGGRRQHLPTAHVYHNKEMILRDFLAADRTAMANERSLLAYVRTSIGLFAAGASAIKFFTTPSMKLVGAVCFIAGICVFIVGLSRYRFYARKLARIHTSDYSRTKV